MKIGSKIALFYTLLSVLTTIIIIAVFYLFSTQFINKLYASYLREKAYLTAQKHWEKDEIDEQSYQIIQRKMCIRDSLITVPRSRNVVRK